MKRVQLVDIQEYPRGEPLERPLHVKRRRVWSPSLNRAGRATGIGDAPVAGLVSGAGEASGAGDAPEAGEAPGAGLVSGAGEASGAGDAPGAGDALGAGEASGSRATNFSPMFPPSPAMYLECGTVSPRGRPNRPHPRPTARRSLHEADIEQLLNYGSEIESDESDDEVMNVPVASRLEQAAAETPQDTTPNFVLPTVEANVEATNMPHNIFDFKWTQFPEYLDPRSRREEFSDIGVGPTTPCDDPYQVFVSIWNPEIMAVISQATNRYAQQQAAQKILNGTLGPNSRLCDWKDTTPNELYVYFAIVLAMGIVIKSKIEEYWQSSKDIFATPYFSVHMSLRRFQLLNTCLHFRNNEDMCAEELSPSEAKLFKIGNIINYLNAKFQELYLLEQNLSLDESLLQWKGWLSINQFIRNKAATVGIKTYELCESRTGYLWRFEVHAHRKTSHAADRAEPLTPLEASTPAIVLRLLSGLEHKGHTIWMDNFYNSPALARHLKCLGFDVVGTLRTNRQFVPQELMSLTKINMAPGQITGVTSGDVDLLVWQDQNRVATISTYHGNATTISHDGSTKPIVVLDYNTMMGGVDKKDQILSMYPIERKRTNVWYKKLFRRLLNISVLNSHIISKKSGSLLSHRSFRISLVSSLLSRHSKSVTSIATQHFPTYEAKTHYIAEYPVGKNKSRLRRKCCVCNKLTHFYCVGCNKTVCLCNCFVSIHS